MLNLVADYIDSRGLSPAGAFAAAVPDAIAAQKTLYIPSGTYDLSGMPPVVVNGALRLEGSGPANAVLTSDGSANLFQLKGASLEVSNLAFENFRDIINVTAPAAAMSIVVDNCRAENFYRLLWSDTDATGFGLDLCRISNSTFIGSGAPAIRWDRPYGRVWIADNVFSSITTSAIRLGINAQENVEAFAVSNISGNVIEDVKLPEPDNFCIKQDIHAILIYGRETTISDNQLIRVCGLRGPETGTPSETYGIYTKAVATQITNNKLVDFRAPFSGSRGEGLVGPIGIMIKGTPQSGAEDAGAGPFGYLSSVSGNQVNFAGIGSGIALNCDQVLVQGNFIKGANKGIGSGEGTHYNALAIKDNVIDGRISHGLEPDTTTNMQMGIRIAWKNMQFGELSGNSIQHCRRGIFVSLPSDAHYEHLAIKGNSIHMNAEQAIVLQSSSNDPIDHLEISQNTAVNATQFLQINNASTGQLKLNQLTMKGNTLHQSVNAQWVEWGDDVVCKRYDWFDNTGMEVVLAQLQQGAPPQELQHFPIANGSFGQLQVDAQCSGPGGTMRYQVKKRAFYANPVSPGAPVPVVFEQDASGSPALYTENETMDAHFAGRTPTDILAITPDIDTIRVELPFRFAVEPPLPIELHVKVNFALQVQAGGPRFEGGTSDLGIPRNP